MTYFGHNIAQHQFSKNHGHWSSDRNDHHAKPHPTDSTPVPEHDARPDPVPTPAPTTPATPDTPTTPAAPEQAASPATQLETALLKLINDDRAEVGAKALTFDSELITAARDHSAWMDKTDTFSHTGLGGSSPTARMEDAGYDAVRTAENIAYIGGSKAAVLDLPDVVQLHTNLMNSPGHKANILNPALTEIGLGLKQGDIKGMAAVFVTEDFGTPTAAEAAEHDGVGLVGLQHTAADIHHV